MQLSHESLKLTPKAASIQVIASVEYACNFIPLMQFVSGIVFVQYGKFFFRQASRKSQVAFRLGTIGILLHLAQVIVDMWSFFHSLQYYASGKMYTYFLYEALHICLAVGVIMVVQYHFFRLAYATDALSNKWTVPLVILCLGACVGGLGASFEFFRQFRQSGFDSATPLVIRGQLLTFYIMWLGCNGFTDGAITCSMVKALYNGRGFVKHKSLRTTLSRLLTVIINTFSLTYIAAMLSLIATILPHIIPNFSFKAEMMCQTAGFLLNGLLSRIYLISFFCSFQEPSYFSVTKSHDSCVASLGGISNSSLSRLSDSSDPTSSPSPLKKRVSRRRQQRDRVHITRQVQVVVDEQIDDHNEHNPSMC
ncbi:hypothetical protein MJO28_006684 [Puccinia striiformis f. sp. tritici]|uniref:Uncharacterized protein n=1 Tax=Puccinia striiformis f. sp. tritici TaxID=168172 RepID=A0ACC0EHI9_9BASI|nr:hypothetical protein MJO28_006684 [Puccinia striiformis f. sp. tritici]